MDVLHMLPGDDLIPRIAAELSKSDCVLAIISRNSIKSPWVTAELAQALQLEIAARGPRVIPVRLDDCEIPTFLARKIVADFSSPAVMATSLKSLLAAISSTKPTSDFTRRDEFEMLMERMTLRGDDARRAAVLCSSILSTVKNVLLTAYRLGGRSPYGHVPPLRVLLFTAHEEFQCLRLQLRVSDPTVVIHCRHRFTTDPHRQRFLNPAAQAWRSQSQTSGTRFAPIVNVDHVWVMR